LSLCYSVNVFLVSVYWYWFTCG